MKELMTKIQEKLQAATGNLADITDAMIFISPDLDIIPSNPTFPLIGIKDGDVESERTAVKGATPAEDRMLMVEVAAYVLLETDGESFLATDPTTYSLLDIADDVRTELLDRTANAHLLGISGMFDNYSPDESGSENMGAEELAVQRKILSFWYRKRVYA